MDQTSVTAAGVIDTFLVLLLGIGPQLALVPFQRSIGPTATMAVWVVVH